MLTIEDVKNLVWSSAENKSFDCEVKYAEFNEAHITTVTGDDTYSHMQELWSKANSGAYGQIASYVAPLESESIADLPQPSTTGAQEL